MHPSPRHHVESKVLSVLFCCLIWAAVWQVPSTSDSPSSPGWPDHQYFSLDPSLPSATPGMLLTLNLSADLRNAPAGMVFNATLILDSHRLAGQPLTFFLNSGLKIESLRDTTGRLLPYERSGEAVTLPSSPPEATGSGFSVITLRYRGYLRSHNVYSPATLSTGISKDEYLFLPPQALWYPLFPGQSFTGQLRAVTSPGVSAFSCTKESRIIEKNGRRTTDFQWPFSIKHLALLATTWPPARVQQGQLDMDLLIPPRELKLRSKLYTLVLQKIDFFSRAFYPRDMERFTLCGHPDDSPPAWGRAMLALPASEVDVHLLGAPVIDRQLARQWFGELLHFPRREQEVEKGFAEFAARLYLEEVFSQRASQLWRSEGRWLTRFDTPTVSVKLKTAWALRSIMHQLGKPFFYELNLEFFDRHLRRQVNSQDYLQLAEEIFSASPECQGMARRMQPWFENRNIPQIVYGADRNLNDPSSLLLSIQQEGPEVWDLITEVEVSSMTADGTFQPWKRKKIQIDQKHQTFLIEAPKEKFRVELDPDWKMLFKRRRVSE